MCTCPGAQPLRRSMTPLKTANFEASQEPQLAFMALLDPPLSYLYLPIFLHLNASVSLCFLDDEAINQSFQSRPQEPKLAVLSLLDLPLPAGAAALSDVFTTDPHDTPIHVVCMRVCVSVCARGSVCVCMQFLGPL
jgi:hypothetical protein